MCESNDGCVSSACDVPGKSRLLLRVLVEALFSTLGVKPWYEYILEDDRILVGTRVTVANNWRRGKLQVPL